MLSACYQFFSPCLAQNKYAVKPRVLSLENAANLEKHDKKDLDGFVIPGKISLTITVFDPADILAKAPGLILTDLLMPEKDSIQLMRELKAAGCQAKFIIISQVSSKEMIARAYSTGVDFYVYKPINRIEACQVLRNAEKQIENERALTAVRSVFAALCPDAPRSMGSSVCAAL